MIKQRSNLDYHDLNPRYFWPNQKGKGNIPQK